MSLPSIWLFCFWISVHSFANDLLRVNDDVRHYRGGKFDDVNSLYFFLKYHDIDVDYEEDLLAYCELNANKSLLDLKKSLNEFGLTCEIVSCTPELLAELDSPAIVLLESFTGLGHRFSVVIPSDNKETFLVFESGPACIVPTTKDDFRRAWSGYAVVVGPPRSNVAMQPLFFYAILITLVSFVLFLRFKFRGSSLRHPLVKIMVFCFFFASNDLFGQVKKVEIALGEVVDVLEAKMSKLNDMKLAWTNTVEKSRPASNEISEDAFGFFKHVQYQFENGMVSFCADRYELDKNGNAIYDSNSEMLFDGNKFFVGTGKLNGMDFIPDLLWVDRMKDIGEKNKGSFFVEPDLLSISGFTFPAKYGDFPSMPQSEIVRLLHEMSAKVVGLSNNTDAGVFSVNLELVTKDHTYTYILEPSKEFAVRSRSKQQLGGNFKCIRSNVLEFIYWDDREVWLPKKVRVEEFRENSEVPFLSRILEVIEFGPADLPTEGQFVEKFQVGGAVISKSNSKTAKPGGKNRESYVVPVESRELDQAVIRVSELPSFRPKKNWLFWWILVTVLLMIGLLLCIRRKRQFVPR